MTFREFRHRMLDEDPGSLARNRILTITHLSQAIAVCIVQTPDPELPARVLQLPLDLLYTAPDKLLALISSKLKCNQTLFARSCHYRKVDKSEAEKFLDQYHLLGKANCAYHRGLYHHDTLVALASFSKGRKMNRLPAHLRSFELIRFCCMQDITVTGGLSKLLNNFCKEKQVGDVMTYVDRQFSDGASFLRCGFRFHSQTPPTQFRVDKQSYKRTPVTADTKKDDGQNSYLTQNAGNLKLVYTPGHETI